MITGELKSKIDAVWNDFWSGGISNPLEVMEQLTYLLFIKGLDEQQTLRREQGQPHRQADRGPDLPRGRASRPRAWPTGRPYADLRWSTVQEPGRAKEMFDVVDKYVFPFLQERAADEHPRQAHEGRPAHHPHPGAARRRRSTGSTPSRWRTATPRATSTSTCSPRSPPPGRTASSAPPATSSS